ncbi:31332_t:CDS:2, partial [Gigaspora margarita]
SEIEVPVANLTESNSYSPFDEYEVITTQLSKLVNNDNMNSNYDNNSSINLITKNLRVGEIRYFALPIEYLPTSEQGIAIMQYQRGHPSGGGNTKVWCTFLDYDVLNEVNFINEIQNALHKEVNMDTDLYQEENMALNNQKSIEMQTYIKYFAIIALKCPFNNYNCKEKFVVQKCSKHKIKLLKASLLVAANSGIKIAIEFESTSEITSCTLVLSLILKEKHVMRFLYHHSNGTIQKGSIIKHQCDIKYYKIVPNDIKNNPYVILISKEIHKHSPPSPSKVSNKIINKLKTIIEEASEELINITLRKLIS